MTGTEPRNRRHWVFDWRLMLFSGFFLPLVLGLGFWQLERGGEKQQQLEQWQQAAESRSWNDLESSGLEPGQPVVVSGLYSDYSWLLDNRTRDGVPGYEVLTLFYPESGSPVVVNRGWIAGTRQRAELPVFPTPDSPVLLTARVSEYPVPPVLSDLDGDGQSGWPRRVQSLPAERARIQEPGLAAYILKLEDQGQPGAFRADWEPDMMGAQTHYGYALQWFSLATVLIVLTIIASYRKQES